MKLEIKQGTAVSISPESRALLERAHKDGIISLYGGIKKNPSYDLYYSYFSYEDDIDSDSNYSFVRADSVHSGSIVTIEQLEKMLYPNPDKHNLVKNDAVVITRGSHAVIRELAKNHNIPLFEGMETDSFRDEMNWDAKYYKFTGDKIIRNDMNANVISLDEFALKMMGLHKPTSYEVKLNDNYEAIVTKDSIKVGCQIFPHSIVEELKAAIEKFGN